MKRFLLLVLVLLSSPTFADTITIDAKTYDVDIKKSLDSDDDKVTEILKSRLPVENDKINFKKTGSAVDITIPEEIYRADGLAIIKHFTQMDLFKFVPSLTKVNFVESYENKQKPKKEMITPDSENKVELKSKK